jgi:hypothetical protein
MVERAFVEGSHVGVLLVDYRLQRAPPQMIETWARSAVSIAVPVVLLGDEGIPTQAAYFAASDHRDEALERQLQQSTVLMRRSRPMEAGRDKAKPFWAQHNISRDEVPTKSAPLGLFEYWLRQNIMGYSDIMEAEQLAEWAKIRDAVLFGPYGSARLHHLYELWTAGITQPVDLDSVSCDMMWLSSAVLGDGHTMSALRQCGVNLSGEGFLAAAQRSGWTAEGHPALSVVLAPRAKYAMEPKRFLDIGSAPRSSSYSELDRQWRLFASNAPFNSMVSQVVLTAPSFARSSYAAQSLLELPLLRHRRISPEFMQFLPTFDLLRNMPKRRTCAVVAHALWVGGGEGFKSIGGRGAEIDEHEFVMRLNGAPTGPPAGLLANHSGTKTSMYVKTHLANGQQGPTLCGHHGSAGPHHFEEYCIGAIQHSEQEFHFARVALTNESAGPLPLIWSEELSLKLQELHMRVGAQHPGWSRYRYPSTGQFGIMLALQICESPPDLYGFDPGGYSAAASDCNDPTFLAKYKNHESDPKLHRPEANPYAESFHSWKLEHAVLEYLHGHGLVNWIRSQM